ncbi:MAG: hypothetical protein HKM28_00965, partial [Flavobacteriaceae bacterium]|nr:hypothetical protein [Flavobacteriaceae bacterium]
MKRLLLILTVMLSTSVMMAQENEKEFNQWSIEVSGGVTKPSAPFGDSYNVRGMNPYQG